MALTYEKIATTTLGSTATSIDFTSIGSGYTDLRLVLVATTTNAGRAYRLRFNSDTSSLYSRTNLNGRGTGVSSTRDTGGTFITIGDDAWVGSSTTIPGLTTVDVFSYAGSTFKTLLATDSNDQNGSGTVQSIVGLYRSTSAITSISLFLSGTSETFKVGTTATIYGILKA
jgi:hypothetical protein